MHENVWIVKINSYDCKPEDVLLVGQNIVDLNETYTLNFKLFFRSTSAVVWSKDIQGYIVSPL